MCKDCENCEELPQESGVIDSARVKGDRLVIEYEAYSVDSSFDEKIKVKFCPMCGRDLTTL